MATLNVIANIDDAALNPGKLLKQSLGATQMTAYATELFTRWPNLREAAHKLAALMTRMWPDSHFNGTPLFDVIIREALVSAMRHKDHLNDQSERNAFIHSVVENLPRFFEFQLCCKTRDGWRRFEPLDESLTDWIAQYKPKSLNWTDEPHPAGKHEMTKYLCAARVFRLRDLESAGSLNNANLGDVTCSDIV